MSSNLAASLPIEIENLDSNSEADDSESKVDQYEVLSSQSTPLEQTQQSKLDSEFEILDLGLTNFGESLLVKQSSSLSQKGCLC